MKLNSTKTTVMQLAAFAFIVSIIYLLLVSFIYLHNKQLREVDMWYIEYQKELEAWAICHKLNSESSCVFSKEAQNVIRQVNSNLGTFK